VREKRLADIVAKLLSSPYIANVSEAIKTIARARAPSCHADAFAETEELGTVGITAKFSWN